MLDKADKNTPFDGDEEKCFTTLRPGIRRYDTQSNDIQPNDTQHNGTQHNDTQHKGFRK
jgi:hypothetical protein